MKCNEVQDFLSEYWSLPEDDWNRIRIDEHVKHCKSCREELNIWRESLDAIQSLRLDEEVRLPEPGKVSSSVMERIYADEGWRVPVAEKMYHIPRPLRLRFMMLVAACLALFGTAFLYNLINPVSQPNAFPAAGVMSGNELGTGEITGFSIAGLQGVTVASIGDPIVLGMTVIDTYPNYLFVLSMFGFICALLLLNWISRIRA